MTEPGVYLLAAGGHARVVLDTLLRQNVAITGILDGAAPSGQRLFGVPILGGDDLLDGLDPARVLLVNGLGANPHVGPRRSLFERMRCRGFSFLSVRHDAAVIARECKLAGGCQVLAGAVLQPGVVLEENCVVSTRSSIDHDSVVGAHAFVAPGVTICGNVRVGEGAFVGAGAVVLPGVEIASGTIVGAGSVVRRDAGTQRDEWQSGVMRGTG